MQRTKPFVETVVVGPLETNCYLVSASEGAPVTIIDPGDYSKGILERLGNRTVSEIVLTHRHFDHLGALVDTQKATGAPVAAYSVEASAILDPAQNLSDQMAIPTMIDHIDTLLSAGDKITLPNPSGEDLFLEVFHTPGHTEGSISLFGEGICFSGDTLFAGGSFGRCDLPTGSETQIAESLRTFFGSLPDEVIIYPGHGPKTQAGIEKRLNPYITYST